MKPQTPDAVRRPRWRAVGPAALAVLACSLFGASCRRNQPGTTARTEDLSRDPVSIELIAEPGLVLLNRDFLVTFRITTPEEISVAWPSSLEDRFPGFRVAGIIDSEPMTASGKIVQERRVRLLPVIADEYRLAPIAISWSDRREPGHPAHWFPTRAVTFDPAPPHEGRPDSDITDALAPWTIRLPARRTALYAALVLLIVAALGGAWWLARHVHRRIRLARLSPRERALQELADLLAKDWIRKDRVKDFYLELTRIVRQYIERAHSIRAPEQTTEEFLLAASRDPRFGPAIMLRLRQFLEAADLVKFAAYHPSADAVDHATGTARNYIETDAASSSTAPDASVAEGRDA